MQVRISSVTRRGKTYQYAQLVESVRREDGLPIHRVIANLGRVTDPVQVENLQAAFAANRSGHRLAPVTLDAVVISHDHYDHLDYATLASRT